MKIKNSYNTVVIGSGPGGLFAMLELAKNDIKSLLVEKDNTLGGMAFNTDLNLQDYDGLPAESDLGKKLFNSNKIANELIAEVFSVFRHYGLSDEMVKSKNNFKNFSNKLFNDKCQYVEHKILPVKFTLLRKIVSNIFNDLKNNKNSNILFNSEVKSIKKNTDGQWKVMIKKSSGEIISVMTDNVIFATGKLSILWFLETLSSLGVDYKENSSICLGVRLEENAGSLIEITRKSLNPKIKIFKDGCYTETFCWCVNGGVMSYDFYGSKILDGMHLHEKPLKNTSFGIMVTLQLPAGISNINFSLAFAKLINSFGGGKIILQRFEDFKKGIPTTKQSLKNNNVKPSLESFILLNIKSCFPQVITDGIISLISKINKMYGDVISNDCLIYAPIIERIFPFIKINSNMETNRKGIFLVGDCAGKSIGVISATTMGIKAAKFIINNSNNNHGK